MTRFKKLIKDYFSQFEKINASRYKQFLKNNPLIKKFCLRCIKRYSHVYVRESDILIKIINDLSVKYCIECGKPLLFRNWKKQFCSHDCQWKSKLPIEKQQQTCLEKYRSKKQFVFNRFKI